MVYRANSYCTCGHNLESMDDKNTRMKWTSLEIEGNGNGAR